MRQMKSWMKNEADKSSFIVEKKNAVTLMDFTIDGSRMIPEMAAYLDVRAQVDSQGK